MYGAARADREGHLRRRAACHFALGLAFTETKEEYQRRADEAKQLLTRHLGRQSEGQGQAASGK